MFVIVILALYRVSRPCDTINEDLLTCNKIPQYLMCACVTLQLYKKNLTAYYA